LAEELDRDPLAIFVFRGHSRAQLVASLRDEGSPTVAAQRSTSAARPGSPEPLPATPEAFWNGGKLPDDFHGEVSIPETPAALPQRLGSFPFWRGEEPFLDTLIPIYQAASPLGLDVFVGSFADEE
jgi:uncharacterized Zn finger protein